MQLHFGRQGVRILHEETPEEEGQECRLIMFKLIMLGQHPLE